MADALPDEVLHDILSDVVLKFNSSLFTDKYFDTEDEAFTHSRPLLVCKRWLRIATPFLYRVVVIASKEQARALAWTLKQNQELGLFIRKLRSFGGYGAFMEKIILAAPRITDLCLELSVLSRDRVAGLCQGLLSLSPRRLTLHHVASRSNAQIRELTQGICECLKLWSNIETIDLPVYFSDPMLHALLDSPNPESICVRVQGSAGIVYTVVPKSKSMKRTANRGMGGEILIPAWRQEAMARYPQHVAIDEQYPARLTPNPIS